MFGRSKIGLLIKECAFLGFSNFFLYCIEKNYPYQCITTVTYGARHRHYHSKCQAEEYMRRVHVISCHQTFSPDYIQRLPAGPFLVQHNQLRRMVSVSPHLIQFLPLYQYFSFSCQPISHKSLFQICGFKIPHVL